jgi:predicted transposase/invertase (TIGR01784 family)
LPNGRDTGRRRHSAAVDDHIFKTILTHPDAEAALISLISAALERQITAVRICNNELPVSDDDEKNERLDVNCVVDDGDQINVEMQASPQVELTDDEYKSFINKYIYYMTDVHSSQKSKGVRYRDLVRTYQVTFCCHPVFPERPCFVSRGCMRFDDGSLISDQINMVIVEMSKLSDALKGSTEGLSLLEQWSLFFRFAPEPEYRELINNIINQNKEIGMAATLLMEISQDEHERARLRSRRKAETDRYSDMATAELRGEMRGEMTKALKIAKDMLADGVDADTVAKWTNLTVDDILRLK